MTQFWRSRWRRRSARGLPRADRRQAGREIESLEPRWCMASDAVSLAADDTVAAAAPAEPGDATLVTPRANRLGDSAVAGPPNEAGFAPSAELFQRFDGQTAWTNFFAPIALRLDSGVLIVIAEARSGVSDRSTFDFVVRRSLDNGLTWSPMFVAHHDDNNINLGSLVQDQQTGRLFLLYAINSSDIAVISSSDEGLNWSKPTNITADVKLTVGVESWGLYAPGPAPGIQLVHGPYAGRLIVTANHRLGFDRLQPSFTNTIYSDDHGQTWHRGGGLAETAVNFMTNEATIVERNNGDLYLNMRVARSGDLRRAHSVSTDGGATWSDAVRDSALNVPPVQGSLLRVNDNLILFAAPSNSVDSIRREFTIWSSTDDAQTWTERKTLFFDRASYGSLALAGPGQVLVAYNRSHQLDSGSELMQIGYALIDLDWLAAEDPYQFNYYFDERQPGESALVGGTIFDFGPWDNRLRPQSADLPPAYVAGRNGDAALSLSGGADNVLLAQRTSAALRFNADESFTVEALVRLTSPNGALIGSDPAYASFAIDVIDGKLVFSLTDGITSVSAEGTAAINDAAWHRIAVVRDAPTKALRLYVDGQLDAAVNYLVPGVLQSDAEYTIGSRPDLSKQLGVDVDTLRITRALLTPAQFLPIDAVGPGYRQPPAPPAGSPASLPGLQLWVGAGEHASFFARPDFATPLTAANHAGAVAQSGFDLSENARQLWARNPSHQLFDSRVGYYWDFGGAFSEPPGWYVRNDDPGPGPYDFVQNTGKFTIAATFKLDKLDQDATLFDNINLTTQTPGFALYINRFGSPTLYVSDAVSPARLIESFSSVKVSVNTWYQIVVVGNGPGAPATLYLTPLANAAVQSYVGASPLVGADGNYPASKARTLMMGSRAATVGSTLDGGMTDMLIYDRPLAPAEVQTLLDFSRRPFAPQPHKPIVNSVFTNENSQTVEPIIVTRHPADGPEVTHFRISGMFGGTVQLADGVTPVTSGEFIDVAQGLAGLKFTPSPGFLGEATFTIQASVGATTAGLGFESAVAIVQVGPPNLPPTFQVPGPMWVYEDGPRQIVPNYATNISPGGPAETGQIVAFQVTTDNPSMFAEQPAIAADGTLTFQPAADANGVANLYILARDNGGTASGGSDTSSLAIARIIGIPVNDPPRFTPGRDLIVPAGSGQQSFPQWATGIAAGPADEVSQTIQFQITNDRPDLFEVQPQLSASGSLTFRPVAAARGVAHLSVVAEDNGGDINGGSDRSDPISFAIGIGPSLTIAGGAGDDAFRIVRVGDSFAIYRNSEPAPIEQQPIADWIGLAFEGLDGRDRLTVDLTGGNPLTPLVRFEGGNGADLVKVLGAGSGQISVSSSVASEAVGAAGEGVIGVSFSRIQFAGAESLDASHLEEVVYRSPRQGNIFDVASGSTSSRVLSVGATLPLTFLALGTLRLGTPDSGARQTADEIVVAGNSAFGVGRIFIDSGVTGDYVAVDAPFANLAWPADAVPHLIAFRGVASLENSQQLAGLYLSGGSVVLSGVNQTVSTESVDVQQSARITIGAGNALSIGSGGLKLAEQVHLTKSGAGQLAVGAVGPIGSNSWLDVLDGVVRLLADGGPNLNLSTAATLEFAHSQNLNALAVLNGGVARLAVNGSRLLSTNSLSIAPAGQLDLTDNGLRVHTAGNAEAVGRLTGLLRLGRNGGHWNGLGGLVSSTAASDATMLTGLSGQLNDYGLGDTLTSHLFGVPVLPTDFVVRYAYSGDINLDGIVDDLDYQLIDLSYTDTTSTYFAGDLDLDGKIDGTDYAILDNSFNFQGQPLDGQANGSSANGVVPVGGAAEPTAALLFAAPADRAKQPALVVAWLPISPPPTTLNDQRSRQALGTEDHFLVADALVALDDNRPAAAPSPWSAPRRGEPVLQPAPEQAPLADAVDLLDDSLVDLLAESTASTRRG